MEVSSDCGIFYKFLIICTICIVYKFVKFVFENLVAVTLQLEKIDLKDYGKWAG